MLNSLALVNSIVHDQVVDKEQKITIASSCAFDDCLDVHDTNVAEAVM